MKESCNCKEEEEEEEPEKAKLESKKHALAIILPLQSDLSHKSFNIKLHWAAPKSRLGLFRRLPELLPVGIHSRESSFLSTTTLILTHSDSL